MNKDRKKKSNKKVMTSSKCLTHIGPGTPPALGSCRGGSWRPGPLSGSGGHLQGLEDGLSPLVPRTRGLPPVGAVLSGVFSAAFHGALFPRRRPPSPLRRRVLGARPARREQGPHLRGRHARRLPPRAPAPGRRGREISLPALTHLKCQTRVDFPSLNSEGVPRKVPPAPTLSGSKSYILRKHAAPARPRRRGEGPTVRNVTFACH